MAEGVGFEPTVPMTGTTVFETARFGHSRIPPAAICTLRFDAVIVDGHLAEAGLTCMVPRSVFASRRGVDVSANAHLGTSGA